MGCKKRAREFGGWAWNILKAVGQSAMRSELIKHVPQAVGAVDLIDRFAPSYFEEQARLAGGDVTPNHLRRKFVVDSGMQLAKTIDHKAFDPNVTDITPGQLESALRADLENALYHHRNGVDWTDQTDESDADDD